MTAQKQFRQVSIVVEGQTEEQFVTQILQPCMPENVWLTPIIAHTSQQPGRPAHKGGAAWRHYRSHLVKLCKQPQWALVTTMIDLYGFPKDGPALDPRVAEGGPDRAEALGEAMRSEISDRRFLPFIMVHEFEALVIAAGGRAVSVLGDTGAARRLADLLEAHDGNAEAIDGVPHTCPSARVSEVLDHYSKTRDGIAVIAETGLSKSLVACPRLSAWVQTLRG